MRIFLDANVLFSLAFSNGAVRRLIADLREASHTLVADQYVFEEALRNLSIQRPEAVGTLHEQAALMTIVATVSPGCRSPAGVDLPAKDVPVLTSAIAAGYDILMTGDSRHFGHLFGRTIAGVTVHSPVDTARALHGGGAGVPPSSDT